MSEVATRARPSIDRPKPKKASPRVALREPVHKERVAAVTREPAHSKPERTRRRKLNSGEDQFWLPVDEIPDSHKAEVDGNLIVSYEWKRFSTMGQEDPFYIASLREQGWEAVPPSRHPNWLPPGYTGQHIIKGGLMLMERPIELSIEAYHEGRALAKRQVRDAEARLGMTPKGELTRNFPGVEPRITKEYVRPMPIQGED